MAMHSSVHLYFLQYYVHICWFIAVMVYIITSDIYQIIHVKLHSSFIVENRRRYICQFDI